MHATTLRILERDVEADRVTKRAAELEPSFVAYEMFQQALVIERELGQPEMAERVLSRAVDRNGQSKREYVMALHCRAMLRSHLGRDEEAFEDYTKIVRLAPKTVDYRLARADTALFLKRYAAAMEDAEAVLRIQPQEAFAHELLRKVRGPEELAAAVAGRKPDYRPAGPVQKVPITVSYRAVLMGHVAAQRPPAGSGR